MTDPKDAATADTATDGFGDHVYCRAHGSHSRNCDMSTIPPAAATPTDSTMTNTATGDHVGPASTCEACYVEAKAGLSSGVHPAIAARIEAERPVAATPTASGNCDTDPGCGSHCVCVTPAATTPTAAATDTATGECCSPGNESAGCYWPVRNCWVHGPVAATPTASGEYAATVPVDDVRAMGGNMKPPPVAAAPSSNLDPRPQLLAFLAADDAHLLYTESLPFRQRDALRHIAEKLRLNAALRDIIGMEPRPVPMFSDDTTDHYVAGHNAAVADIQSRLADALTPGWRDELPAAESLTRPTNIP